MQEKKPLSLNPLQTDLTLLAKLLRPFARSFRVVRKEISTIKRRCHNELTSVLLWLSFVIVTEETGYEYWQIVKLKTTVFSLQV